LSVTTRLNEALRNAYITSFDRESKFIFFSDCHRGVNDWADDFAHNQSIFFYAIQWYNRRKYTYVEVGDGDELWENKSFCQIREAHSHIFWELAKFHEDRRMIMLYGNHDIEKHDRKLLQEDMCDYFEKRSETKQPLFPELKVYESLLLKPPDGGMDILVLHGHQADPINDRYWRLSRFFSRYFWRPLQLLGLHDFTSPAQNFNKANKIERRLTEWTREKRLITIAGHTHRPHFPDKHSTPYYNSGSCVHPRSITGIEITKGEIVLIKWSVTADENGALKIQRQELEGPRRLIGG
jgi:UDP-2,3-diacylglucosamine pyrophosphatase LpxH